MGGVHTCEQRPQVCMSTPPAAPQGVFGTSPTKGLSIPLSMVNPEKQIRGDKVASYNKHRVVNVSSMHKCK